MAEEGSHRWIGDYAQEVAVGDKRVMLAPGDFVDLSSEDQEANQALLDGGSLIAVADLPQDEVEKVEEPSSEEGAA